MSSRCGYPGDREGAIVAYVYDEGPADERAAFVAHLAACTECRGEVDAFRGVRRQLAHWSPPAFDVLAGAHANAGERRGRFAAWRDIPAWAQLAAAMLILGAAAGLANLDVHYDRQSGLDVRTGWASAAQARAAAAPAPGVQASSSAQGVVDTAAASGAPWRADLAALEQQLRREMHAAPPSGGPAFIRAPSSNDAEVLRRVKALVDESEKRQQRELALRVTTLMQDLNAQRQADLRKIDQTLGLIQDRTGVEVLRNRQMIDFYMQRASQRR